MKDPFAKARLKGGFGPNLAGNHAPSSPASPMAATPTMASTVLPHGDFHTLSKQMGLGHMTLDKNPATARTQLMQHLQHKFGVDYMQNADVQRLLDSFNGHYSTSDLAKASTGQQKNMQALMGGPG